MRIISPLGPYPFLVEVPSRYIDHTITVWVYLPPLDKLPGQSQYVPTHVDFHGGSFIMGRPLEHAPFCSILRRAGQRKRLHCLMLSLEREMTGQVKAIKALGLSEWNCWTFASLYLMSRKFVLLINMRNDFHI